MPSKGQSSTAAPTSIGARCRHSGRSYRQEILAGSFLWPSLLILAALLIYPLGDVIRLSFYDSNLQRQTWVGLRQLPDLAQDPLFWKSLLQTVFFTACSVALHLVIGLTLAVLLNPASTATSARSHGGY